MVEDHPENEILFEEKQYLGHNKFSLLRRTVFAIFCFLIYFYSDEIPEIKGVNVKAPLDLLFFLGIFVLLLSVALVFVLHLHTKLYSGHLLLEGWWTARKVKIDLSAIEKVQKVPYSKYLLNPPVYNLHRKGYILFFCRGNEAVQLVDRDGLKYRIGTQKPEELYQALKKIIQN